MTKKLLLIILAVSTLFIFGCTRSEDTLVAGPFVGGTNGLTMRFIENEPPSSVFDDNEEDFDIAVLVENVGEYNIPARKIIATLSGVDYRDFGLGNANVLSDIDLNGKEKIEGETFLGDETELRYDGLKYKPDLYADWETKIRVDVCYEYETTSTTKVCLKKKVTDRTADDVCQINNQNVDVFNSGSPIQIKNVRERGAGNTEIQLTFTVQNVGAGLVYEPGTFSSECMRDRDKEDRLELEVVSGSRRHQIKCSQLGNSNQGEIKLTSDNQKQITCRIKTSSATETASEEPINIKARYFYRNAITKAITIEDSEDF